MTSICGIDFGIKQMKLSDKRKTKLYAAAADPIMDLRVEIQSNPSLLDDIQAIDKRLYDLSLKIWDKQQRVLNIQD